MGTFQDVFDLLSDFYTEEDQLKEEIKKVNKRTATQKHSNKLDPDNMQFEKAWAALNVPKNACVMKCADFNKMFKQIEELKW